MSRTLLLLPSVRACQTLSHEILDSYRRQGGRDALLLPRLTTPSQLATEIGARLGLLTEDLPDDSTRALVLGHALSGETWLGENPAGAAGLAVEFVDFFDEARLHQRDGMLLQSDALDPVLALETPAEAEILTADLEKMRRVWRLYRQAVPRDRTDHLVEVAAAIDRDGWPGRRPERVFVGGFGRLDPVRAGLLRAALDAAADARLFVLQDRDRTLRSRLFLATWGPGSRRVDPLAPTRQVRRLLTDEDAAEPAQDVAGSASSLRGRLAAVGGTESLTDPGGPLELLPCSDSEAESRAVADRVVRLLGEAGDQPPRIGLAVNDPRLAARITAQLRDAGVDVDNTHGEVLSALPAGLLLRFLLRAALTELRAEPLLEVLTSPYVQLPQDGRDRKWTRRLEGLIRDPGRPRNGLNGVVRKAWDRDEAATKLFGAGGGGMVEFVLTVAGAFEPLLVLRAGRHGWADLLEALAAVWNALAPRRSLAETADRPDITAAARLLDRLGEDAQLLPPVSLAEFSADLGLLLGRENVPAHRARNLPVLVAGVVEARLERFDHLFLAGMKEGIFPTRPPRPLLLSGRIRERLGLPTWCDALGRDAELFLRLVHNGERVTITWAADDEGRPGLPSPFVSRLLLGLAKPPPPVAGEVLWREKEVDEKEIAAAGAAFVAEGLDPAVHAQIRPLDRLSWSALSRWRDCPYRFLLARGFALAKPEEVRREFGRRDYGNLVHEALKDWLDPAGPGLAALQQGDEQAARRCLEEAALAVFARDWEDLPVRRLWLDSFRRTFDALTAHELDRCREWSPLALEEDFELPLPDLVAWIKGEGDGRVDLPGPTATAAEIRLTGRIDRIDRRRDGTGGLAVIDYKTGKLPAVKNVVELEELQVALYALAVECGAVASCGEDPDVFEGRYYAVSDNEAGGPQAPHLDLADAAGRERLRDAAIELVRLATGAADTAARFSLIPRERAGEGPSPLPCRHCDFRGICRLEEKEPLTAATRRKLDTLVNRKEGFQ